MDIRKAKIDEVTEVRHWLMDTARWLKEKNIPQWERFLEYQVTEVCLEDYYNNKLFVLLDDRSNLVGSLSFGGAEEIDKSLWEDSESAYYIHRLVINKEFKNKRYGEFIINWAKNIAIRHCKELRLNCAEENNNLLSYYKKQGFNYYGCKLGYHLLKIINL